MKKLYWILVNFIFLCMAACLGSCTIEANEIECSYVIDYDRSYHCAVKQLHLLEEAYFGDRKYTSYLNYPLEDDYELEIYLITYNNLDREPTIVGFPSLRDSLGSSLIKTYKNDLTLERCGKYPKGKFDILIEIYDNKNNIIATRDYRGTFNVIESDLSDNNYKSLYNTSKYRISEAETVFEVLGVLDSEWFYGKIVNSVQIPSSICEKVFARFEDTQNCIGCKSLCE